MGRFAFSLRDGLAVILVAALMLGCYRMGYDSAVATARQQNNELLVKAVMSRISEMATNDDDWLTFRRIALQDSPDWQDGNAFRRWKLPASSN